VGGSIGYAQGRTTSIKHEDWDTGRVDFADVTAGRRIPLTHRRNLARRFPDTDKDQRLRARAGDQGAALKGRYVSSWQVFGGKPTQDGPG